MAYHAPAMPLMCAIWHGYDPAVSTYAAPDLTGVPCNLSPGKRIMSTYEVPGPLFDPWHPFAMELLLPNLTDIRAAYNAKPPDVVEVPEGSGCLYRVSYVDDIAKGFPNVYRWAFINQAQAGVDFTDTTIGVPIPRP